MGCGWIEMLLGITKQEIVSESYRAQKHVESAKSKYSDVYNLISYYACPIMLQSGITQEHNSIKNILARLPEEAEETNLWY